MRLAPMNAPEMTERKSGKMKLPAVMLPPPISKVMAAPKLAPELMPKMEESANGLLNTVCSINPEAERAAPQNNAVMHCGKRDSQMMNSQLGFSILLPVRQSNTAWMGISTEPNNRLAMIKIPMIMAKTMQ